MNAAMLFLVFYFALLRGARSFLLAPTVGLVRRSIRHLTSEDMDFEQHMPFKRPRTQNAPGNLFVDESCIDCDVCRWMCPNVFSRIGVKSAVQTQPQSEEEKLSAYAAMIACPVGSIRTYSPDPLVKQALDIFPAEIDAIRLPGVFHAGYHSEDSFGATPYFISRTEGNVMIDSPRFNSRLADTIESEGGLKYMILTHRDDVADHAKWKKRFPDLQRIIHRLDVTPDTVDCEVKLDGFSTWNPAADITIIHTPGHTAGSVCVLYKPAHTQGQQIAPDSALFTGDHVAYSGTRKALTGFPQYNHDNLQLQTDSMRLLADDRYSYNWILPGHGRMVRFASPAEKKAAILKAADVLENSSDIAGLPGAIGYD